MDDFPRPHIKKEKEKIETTILSDIVERKNGL